MFREDVQGYSHWLYLSSFSSARVSARHSGYTRPKCAVTACTVARPNRRDLRAMFLLIWWRREKIGGKGGRKRRC